MSKEFISDQYLVEIPQEPAFQMAWPQLQPKVYTSSFHQYLKEMEERVLRQTKERSLAVEKDAYEKGFAQGEKDGLELGERRIETIVHQLKHLLLEIERQREDLFKVFEREMLQLAVSISKKVTHHELTLHEDVISAVLKEAFQYVVDRRKVMVHLNPADCQYLLNHPEGFLLTQDERGGVRMIEDHSITRGGCFLETSFGEIDATIEGRFDEIVSLIWERWGQSEQRSDRSNP